MQKRAIFVIFIISLALATLTGCGILTGVVDMLTSAEQGENPKAPTETSAKLELSVSGSSELTAGVPAESSPKTDEETAVDTSDFIARGMQFVEALFNDDKDAAMGMIGEQYKTIAESHMDAWLASWIHKYKTLGYPTEFLGWTYENQGRVWDLDTRTNDYCVRMPSCEYKVYKVDQFISANSRYIVYNNKASPVEIRFDANGNMVGMYTWGYYPYSN